MFSIFFVNFADFRMCLHQRAYWDENIFTVIDHDPTPDDENGPIIATHGSNSSDQGLKKLIRQFNKLQCNEIKPKRIQFGVIFYNACHERTLLTEIGFSLTAPN